MKSRWWLLAGLVALTVLLAGCDLFSRELYLSEDDFPDRDTGKLVMFLPPSGTAVKTIDPVDDMVIRRYVITLQHVSSGQTISETKTPTAGYTEYTKTGLAPGDWDVYVVAYDAISGGDAIGAIGGSVSGHATYGVIANDTVVRWVEIVPLTGMGHLTLGLTWNEGAIEPTVGVDAYLVPTTVADPDAHSADPAYKLPRPWSINEANWTAAYDSDDPATPAVVEGPDAGYYYLYLDVLSDGAVVASLNPESVRIAAGKLTDGDLSLVYGQGGLTLQIVANMEDPVPITWNPAPPASVGASATFSISAVAGRVAWDDPATVGADYEFVYHWYLDGSPLTWNDGDTDDASLVNYTGGSAGVHSLGVVLIERSLSDSSVRTISSEGFTYIKE